MVNNYRIPSLVVGQSITIKCRNNDFRPNRKNKVFKGNVIFVNNRCVIVEGKNYKESFSLSEFNRGDVRLTNE